MRTLTLIACFLCITIQSMAVNPPDHFPSNIEKSLYADDGSIFSKLTLEELATLNKREIRAKIGRKLTFSEWLGVKAFKTKARKIAKKGHQLTEKHRRPFDALSLLAAASSFIGLVLASFIYFTGLGVGLTLGIFGLILGLIGVFSTKRYKERRGEGFALLGLMLGVAAIMIGILFNSLESID